MDLNPYQTPRDEGYSAPRHEDAGAAILAVLVTLGTVAILMFAPILLLIRFLGL